MPELPEVETIRRGLVDTIVGRRIAHVTVTDDRVVEGPISELTARIAGQTVRDLRRRGKYLILELERDCLLIHLGMTGQLTFWDHLGADDERFFRHPLTGLQKARQHAVDRHTHFWLRFEDEDGLHYRDIRKFGRIRLLSREELGCSAILDALGLEPFTPGFVPGAFEQALAGHRRPIKALLLDQHVVAGLGNIYADEALFSARIHPVRGADSLGPEERGRLFGAIEKVLLKGIEHGGTSLRDFVNARGGPGSNQETLDVYGRSGEPCTACGTAIERIVLAGRSTHFCPRCQPAPPAPPAPPASLDRQ